MGEKEFLPSALPNVFFFFSGEKLIAVLILDRVC